MNLKAQVEPLPLIMGVIGGIIGWVMASRMDVGILYKFIVFVLTTLVCYGISWFIANK